MTDDKKKLTIRESLGLLGFGFKTAHRLLPGYFPGVLMQSAVTAVQPLAVLFFSARILNELTGSRNVSNIVFFVSLTIGLTFALSVIKAFLTREIETRAGREQALRRIHMMQAEKFASMDYPHTEDSSVSEVLSRMDVYARGSSRGLIYLYIVPARASDSLFSLVFSSILLANAFSAGGFARGASPAGYALIALFAAGIIVGLRLQSRQKIILQKTAARAASDNTLANYYSNYVKADHAVILPFLRAGGCV